jgi:hypothetical protein
MSKYNTEYFDRLEARRAEAAAERAAERRRDQPAPGSAALGILLFLVLPFVLIVLYSQATGR